jgi:hypothetical protein
MKIHYITQNNSKNKSIDLYEADVYHRAGQAVAISLGNQQKQLPAVHFQICLNPCKSETTRCQPSAGQNYTLTLEGGRLIQSLPLCFAEAKHPQFCLEHADNRCALESDMMNLLVGALAEAKFNASKKGKVLAKTSTVLSMLRLYSSSRANIEPVYDYLESCFSSPVDRQRKLNELFQASLDFINDSAIWEQIKALATYILAQSKTIIDCEEISFFLASWQKSTYLQENENELIACN